MNAKWFFESNKVTLLDDDLLASGGAMVRLAGVQELRPKVDGAVKVVSREWVTLIF